jgi:glycosyltransferase involved in cell wall biosynthesis
LVTDWYAPENGFFSQVLRAVPGSKIRAALAARADDLPYELVRPLRWLGFTNKWRERAAARRGCVFDGYDRTDAAFARAVARLRLPEHEVFFGYSYASLEAVEAEKRRGRLTIVDQIDPGPEEFRMVAEEMARFPDLAGPPIIYPTEHFERARREWELADVIVVNSDWSRGAIVAEGADPVKIEVLPLAYEPVPRSEVGDPRSGTKSQRPVIGNPLAGGKLRVLWLGQVNVRKGIYYLLQAARLLEREPVEFIVAGSLGIRPEVVAGAPGNVKWLGPVPRSQVSELYQQNDVFLLPTLSDGFAITQIEALAHGLPVIVTRNCGRVVEDGVTGFLVPPRDSEALAGTIAKFILNRRLASEMSPRCIEASKVFSIDAYGKKLVQFIEKHTVRRRPSEDTYPLASGVPKVIL